MTHLDRYPDIQMARRVHVSQICTLRVAVTIQPISQEFAAAAMATMFPETNEAVEIDVVLTAGDFEILDNTVKQLTVPFDKDSAPVVFRLRPETAGQKKVRVEFFQNDCYVGKAEVTTEITDNIATRALAAAPIEEDACSRTPIRLASAEPPDLQILISQHEGAEQAMQYKFELHAPSIGIFHVLLSDKLSFKGSPTKWLGELYQELSDLIRAEPQGETAVALSTVGTYFYELLFPKELKEIWGKNIRGRVRSIMIISDEPWIPWELIKPSFQDETGTIVEDGFLCEDYVVTRWRRGSPPSSSVMIDSGAVVADKASLYHAEQEANFLTTEPYEFKLVEPTLVSVRCLLKRKDYRLLHFACHGRFDSKQHDQSVLIFGDGDLRVRDISGERKNFGQARPFVFVNACSSSRTDFSLVGIGGWAERFIETNVSGFLGTSWEVDDELAYQFAKKFYEELWTGETIGEAVYKARKAISQANSTWLAYTLYADPNATVTFAR